MATQVEWPLFTPIENKTLSVSSSSSSVTFSGESAEQLRIYNDGPKPVFVRWGTGAQTAVTTDMIVPVGVIEIFLKGSASTIAAITASSSSTIYLSSGRGM